MTDHDRRGVLRFGAASAAATALTGCLPGPPPPPRRFYLTALDTPPPGIERAPWSLVVAPPQTVPALRTTRIAQAIGDNEFDYYADAEWGDPPALMFQAVAIRSFERSDAVALVASERERLRPDFRLTTWLVPFFAVGAVGTPPEARVGVDARLIRNRDREVVATRSFEQARRADSPDIAAVVAAFDAASHDVIRELIVWTVEAGDSAAT
jgi:ABC-type uncharacterized transport system auxiliary subunit